jgi:hypothetical protein
MSKPKVTPREGNAFVIIGACAKAARRAGWPESKWKPIKEDMMAGDYDHLLQTAMQHFDIEVDE